MKDAYPSDPKKQFEFLVTQGEHYIHRTQPVGERTIRQWRRRALDWLKENAPDQELTDAMLVVPQANVQRNLAVLLRARSVVPFLREKGEAVGVREALGGGGSSPTDQRPWSKAQWASLKIARTFWGSSIRPLAHGSMWAASTVTVSAAVMQWQRVRKLAM